MDPADVHLWRGADVKSELVDLLEGGSKLVADPPDIVRDHWLGHAHGVKQIQGGHVVSDDLAATLLCPDNLHIFFLK